jgi:hypothetical protein
MKNRPVLLTAASILIGILTAQASALKIYFGSDFHTSTTKIIFSAEATPGFDSRLDKMIKKLPENKMNYIYSVTDGKRMLFENYHPQLKNYSAIPLQVAIKEAGTFMFNLEDMNNDLADFRFVLFDMKTGETFQVVPGFSKAINFTETDVNTKRNYILHIFRAPVIAASPVSCIGNTDGAVTVSFGDTEQWEAKLRTPSGWTGQSITTIGKASFSNLGAGIYYVETWKGNTKLSEEIVSVGKPAKLKTEFSVSADTITAGEKIFAENLSGTGERWYWEFGDNSNSKQFSPAHIYEMPGTYKLTLTTSDEAGCISSVSKTILVEPGKISSTIVSRLMSN